MNKLSIATIGLIAGTTIGVLIGHVKGARAEERAQGQIAAKWGVGLEVSDPKQIYLKIDSNIEGPFLVTEAELRTKTELRMRSLGIKPIEGVGGEKGEGYLGVTISARKGYGMVTLGYFRPAMYAVNGITYESHFLEPLTHINYNVEGSTSAEVFYEHAFGPALDSFLNAYLKANEGN